VALKAANLTSFSNGQTYALVARFDNIGGLKPRAPVRSAGVVVGRVTSITLDPKSYQGVVMLAIDQRYQFPKDSAAKILTAGLLGDQYVGIEAGGDDADLAAGDVIAQTQSAVVLENLIGQFLTGKAADAVSPQEAGK
jgi:phospholipid/cholesterol/gamma-HCH transport system substrate-binding protein